MSRRGWKAREREAAALIKGKRYPANQGGRVDVESDRWLVQVKAMGRLSLAQLETLAMEMAQLGADKGKIGAVLVKRAAGQGRVTPWLVVMTQAALERAQALEQIRGD